MTKFEKIKEGLKCCTATNVLADCWHCPYKDIENSACVFTLLTDCKEELNKLSGVAV